MKIKNRKAQIGIITIVLLLWSVVTVRSMIGAGSHCVGGMRFSLVYVVAIRLYSSESTSSPSGMSATRSSGVVSVIIHDLLSQWGTVCPYL